MNLNIPLIRVPGTWTEFYQNKYIENRRIEERNGWRLFLSHTKDSHENDLSDDLKPEKIVENNECDVFLHGHLHRPEIVKEGRIYRINPGHLYEHDNRGYPPTYAIISIDEKKIKVTIKLFKSDAVYLEETIYKSIEE